MRKGGKNKSGPYIVLSEIIKTLLEIANEQRSYSNNGKVITSYLECMYDLPLKQQIFFH